MLHPTQGHTHLLPVQIRGLTGRKLSTYTRQWLVKSFSIANASWALHELAEISARKAMAICTNDLSLSSAAYLNLCNLFWLAITKFYFYFFFLNQVDQTLLKQATGGGRTPFLNCLNWKSTLLFVLFSGTLGQAYQLFCHIQTASLKTTKGILDTGRGGWQL